MRATLALTEKQFLAQVRDLARLYGWRFYHTHDSRHSAKGFPDCVLVKAGKCRRPARLIVAELKSATGKVGTEQLAWLTTLSQVGESVETYLWRPDDFDAIVACLSRQ
jgi:VRR-NUC domain-containing protein